MNIHPLQNNQPSEKLKLGDPAHSPQHHRQLIDLETQRLSRQNPEPAPCSTSMLTRMRKQFVPYTAVPQVCPHMPLVSLFLRINPYLLILWGLDVAVYVLEESRKTSFNVVFFLFKIFNT